MAVGGIRRDYDITRGQALPVQTSPEWHLWLAKRREAPSKGPHRGEDEGGATAFSDGFAGQPHAGFVDGTHLFVESVLAQLDAIGAKGIRFDQVGAGVEIRAMNLFDQFGLGGIQRVETVVERDAVFV